MSKNLGYTIRKVVFFDEVLDNGQFYTVIVGKTPTPEGKVTQVHKIEAGPNIIIQVYTQDPEYRGQDIMWKEYINTKCKIEYEARTPVHHS